MSLLPSLISAGSSLIGNILGSFSSDKTNDANAKINAATLEQNQQQFDDSLAWSKEQFDRQLEYNKWAIANSQDFSLKQQAIGNQFNERMLQNTMDFNSLTGKMQQARQAGVNPYTALGSVGSVGSASSSMGSSPSSPGSPGSSSPGASSVGQIPMQNNPYAGGLLGTVVDGLFNLANRKASARAANADAAGQEIDNTFKSARAQAEIDLLKKQSDNYSSRTAYQLLENKLKSATMSDDIDLAHYNALNAQAQNGLILSQNSVASKTAAMIEKRLGVFDSWFARQMRLMTSQIYANSAAGDLSYANASKAAAEQAFTETQNSVLKNSPEAAWSKKTALKYVQSLVDKSTYEALQVRQQTEANPVFTDDFSSGYMKFINTYIHPLGSALWGTAGYGLGAAQKKMNQPKRVKGFR